VTLSSGTRIGSYEILGPLGVGGMGEVYRARDSRLGREVAIKVLPAEVATSHDRLARFEREARTVAGLNHPNIVVLHTVEDVDGVRFLTMELVEGQSLDREVTAGPLAIPRVLEFAIALADALDVWAAQRYPNGSFATAIHAQRRSAMGAPDRPVWAPSSHSCRAARR